MKRILMLLMLLCVIQLSVNAQTIVYAEYSFDSFDAEGSGIPAIIGSPSDSVNLQNISVSTAGLSQGNHVLYLRVLDSDGKWSLYGAYPFTIISNIVAAEYFFNSDPGFGNGTAISVNTYDSINIQNLSVPTSSLPEGINLFTIRVKDINNVWSHYLTMPFKIIEMVWTAEYSFDTLAAPGTGTPINIPVAADSINMQNVSVPTAGLSHGSHLLHLRIRDGNNNWSHYYSLPFTVSGTEIIQAEYSIDTLPQNSAGIPVIITSADSVNISSLSIPTAGLPYGTHKLFIRSKDEYNNWSQYAGREFTIKPGIIKTEYFYNTDPGVGNATAIDVVPATDSLNSSYNFSTTGLGIDSVHSLFMRSLDSSMNWSLYGGQLFYKCGTEVSILQGDSVSLICATDTATLTTSIARNTPYNLQFNGSSTCVKIPDNVALRPNDFTIEASFKATAFTGHLVAKEYNTTTDNSYALYFPSGGTVAGFINGAQVTAGGLSANTWYHVAFVKSGTAISLYVNGSLISSGTCVATTPYDNSSVFIGADDNNNDEIGDAVFNGLIDEVRIWNVARTAAQISANKNTTISPLSNGLVGYWRLDEGSGTVTRDRSYAYNNGTLVNNPVWVTSTSPVLQSMTYSWTPAAGLNSTTSSTVKASPVSTTTYYVTVTETATGCTAIDSIKVKKLHPFASSNSPAELMLCEGATLNLFCQDVNATSFEWTGPNGFTSSQQDPSLSNLTTAAAGTYKVVVHYGANCIDSAEALVSIQPPAQLSLKLYLQGFYTGQGLMNNNGAGGLLYILGLSPNASDVDTVTVSLMDGVNYNLVSSAKGILHTNGTLTVNLNPCTVVGSSFYIKVNHRNTIETWSAVPHLFTGTDSYDFSTAMTQSYGNNVTDAGTPLGESPVWAFYSGDISDPSSGVGYQDGIIESQDYSDMENAVSVTLQGYIPEDITGDALVESLDYSFMENNVYFVVYVFRP